jgi:hypothetical protein
MGLIKFGAMDSTQNCVLTINVTKKQVLALNCHRSEKDLGRTFLQTLKKQLLIDNHTRAGGQKFLARHVLMLLGDW